MHWIKAKREAEGLTQIQLSESIGISQSTLSRIEDGKLVPDFETTRRLAKVLNYKGQKYTLTDGITHEKRTFNVIDTRVIERRGRSATIMITDDNCVLEIIGKRTKEV